MAVMYLRSKQAMVLETWPAAEQRVLLHNVPWQTFEHLLEVLGDTRAARLAYDQGTLEIMSPIDRHESAKSLIGRLIETWSFFQDIDIASRGSLTLRREDLARGVEPDECYYIQNESSIRGVAHTDLRRDPPPDLGVEIDITSPSSLRIAIYAALGVPEVWRYNGETLQVFCLEPQGGYLMPSASRVLAGFPVERVAQWLEQAKIVGESAVVRQFMAEFG
ncbi:Uma2 family endonuclease [Gloeobacter morelensis MG652769]|uniref:Uma2 family endonuclease n=2 Tax=Gloeobacter TaxID=33071 RepID=A0ABY3PNK6_9CYAN|nr:Uma2 family endonuclease [Gloeobacter morelensis MG652769]